MRALDPQELARLQNKVRVSQDFVRQSDIDWLYNDPEAVEQILQEKEIVTSQGRKWKVTYDGNRVIYREVGRLIPMQSVNRDRFKKSA